jgi:hypothetical protein
MENGANAPKAKIPNLGHFLLHSIIFHLKMRQECMIDAPKCTRALVQINYILHQRNRIEIELYQSRS